MAAPTAIDDYLRLCDRQHKRKYVAMSVMCSIIVKPRKGEPTERDQDNIKG
jgi:hypothetical protein